MSALIFHVVGISGRKSISFLYQLAYKSRILSKFAATFITTQIYIPQYTTHCNGKTQFRHDC